LLTHSSIVQFTSTNNVKSFRCFRIIAGLTLFAFPTFNLVLSNDIGSKIDKNSGSQTHLKRTHPLNEGKLLNQYLKLKTIGEGPYSKIKLMRNVDDGHLYAMKKYNLFIMKKKNKLLKR